MTKLLIKMPAQFLSSIKSIKSGIKETKVCVLIAAAAIAAVISKDDKKEENEKVKCCTVQQVYANCL